MLVRQSVVKDIPQFLRGLGSLGSPPEPRAFSLVKRTEDNWYGCALKLLQLYGDGVDIVHQESVVGVLRVLQCSLDVKICGIGIEASVPGVFRGVVEAGWCAPVPLHLLAVKEKRVLDGIITWNEMIPPFLANAMALSTSVDEAPRDLRDSV